ARVRRTDGDGHESDATKNELLHVRILLSVLHSGGAVGAGSLVGVGALPASGALHVLARHPLTTEVGGLDERGLLFRRQRLAVDDVVLGLSVPRERAVGGL